MNTLTKTDFNFPNQISKYSGKVREVYKIKDDVLVMISTDRLSAFDVVLPKGIPYKGQILNQIACRMLNATSHIVPNWLISSPDPNVSIGEACEPFKVEMVVRGYLSGHAARIYKSGERIICGVKMPEGMIENDKFKNPIITPTTKAENGSHDEDISRKEILSNNIVNEKDYIVLEEYSLKLFNEGTKIAKKQGLILVDTKYEFGKNKNGQIIPSSWINDFKNYDNKFAYQNQDKLERFPNGNYRSKWYQTGFDDNEFCAIGIHGQNIWINPKKEITIVRMSSAIDPINIITEELMFSVFKEISKAL